MSVKKISFSIFSLVIVIGFHSCGNSKDVAVVSEIKNDVVVIWNEEVVPNYIGKFVRLEGVVLNTKMPLLLGVDISCDSLDLRNENAWAEGILEKTIVTSGDVDPYSATRGAGTYYQLIDPGTGQLANVRPLK